MEYSAAMEIQIMKDKGGRLLYRGMKVDRTDGSTPRCGETANHLGARKGKDIPVCAEGNVKPKTGGMSMVVDKVKKLPTHMRPWSESGVVLDSSVMVFSIEEGVIPDSLVVRQDSPTARYHRVLEPACECAFTHYQASLYGTQSLWKRVFE